MNKNITSSTVSGEEARQSGQASSKERNRALMQTIGIVTEVHEQIPAVKAKSAATNTPIAQNAWILISMSTLDILQSYGRLRRGMRVLVTHTVNSQTNATAQIIGNEEEDLGIEENQDNKTESGLYEIFTPGQL